MKPNRIILVRHAESEGNVDKNIYETIPDYALDITPKGVEQAQTAGVQIASIIKDESIKFYVSTHKRTIRTWEEIVKKMHEFYLNPKKKCPIWDTYFDPRLREQDWGNYRIEEATKKLEEERDRYGAFHYRFPSGESCADVYDRMSLVLDTLHRDWEKDSVPDNVGIITHGRTMRVFLMRWFKWIPAEFEKYRNPQNCKVVVMQRNQLGKYDLITQMEKYE